MWRPSSRPRGWAIGENQGRECAAVRAKSAFGSRVMVYLAGAPFTWRAQDEVRKQVGAEQGERGSKAEGSKAGGRGGSTANREGHLSMGLISTASLSYMGANCLQCPHHGA